MTAYRVHPSKLGFDFDGVIADTGEAFIRLACEQYGLCDFELEQVTTFAVEDCLDLDAGVAESIFLQILNDSIGSGLKPMKGAVQVLGELAAAATVTIVTARSLPQPVHDWLKVTFPAPVFQRMEVIAMGDHDDKPRHVRQLGLTHFIDDRAQTCLQLQAAGINSIVFSQPWNRNGHSLPTVNSWTDIRRLCL